MKFLESLKGSKTLVFGAGVTGTAATEFLKDAGSKVQVIERERKLDLLFEAWREFHSLNRDWR